MIIKNIKLENFRRFENLELEFPQNIIGIIGKNGTGKSTLIESIGWTLYGNKFGRTDKQDIRSQHVDEKAVCSATIEFEYGGHEYRIVRLLKGKNATSEAAIYRDGVEEPVAVQDRGVNEFIEKLLKLDYKSFTASVFAQQKELDKLSTMTGEERRKSINRLINIDLIDRARIEVRKNRNDKQNFVNGQKSNLKDVDELKSQLKTVQQKSDEQRQNFLDSEKVIKELSTTYESAKKDFELASMQRDRFNDIQSNLRENNARLEQLYQRKEDLLKSRQEIENAAKELEQLKPELDSFECVKTDKEKMDGDERRFALVKSKQGELDLINSSIDKEEKSLDDFLTKAANYVELEQKTNRLMQDENSAVKKINELEEQVKDFHGQLVSVKDAGTKEKEKFERIKKLGPEGECPFCTQKLADHYEQVEQELATELNALRQKYKEIENASQKFKDDLAREKEDLTKIRSEIRATEKLLTSAEEANKNVERIQEALKNYEHQKSLYQKELDDLGDVKYDQTAHQNIIRKYNELLSIQQKAAALNERASRADSVEKELQQNLDNTKGLQNKNVDLKEKLDELNFDESVYQDKKTNLDDQQQKIDIEKDKLSDLKSSLAALKNSIQQFEKEIAEQKKRREEIKETENEIILLTALDEYLGEFRLELAGRIRPLIAHRASELFRLTTQSRYSIIELNEDYDIFIYDGNERFPIKRFSGGEQDLANLCLRIAISQVVAERSGGAPINLIILDEVFGSQDEERRDLILNALTQLSTQFRQIFIITHVESIKEMLPEIVEISMLNEHSSKAVCV